MFTIISRRLAAPIIAAGLVLSLIALAPARPLAAAMAPRTPIALAGYSIAVFARGTAAYTHPDSIVSDGMHLYIAFANKAAKDGSDHRSSTIVEYSLAGKVLRQFSTPGHNDGLRINPATHQLWALSNEDGNPALYIIDPMSGASTRYTFPATPHGGGYDDIAFAHGLIFMDASNPTLNKEGVNVFPALDRVRLDGHRVVPTPVLMGNATATDLTTNKNVSLNLIDPDALTFDPHGALVLDNQAGAQLVLISGVGTARQRVTSLPIGTQVDETAFATAARGRLIITDTDANVIYQLRSTFTPGTAYTASQSDSGVTGMVGSVDLKTGFISPVAIGLASPHGMLFLPGM